MEQAKVSLVVCKTSVHWSSRQLADSMKRFNYLLGQTELFQHFVDLKVSRADWRNARLMVAATRARVREDAG